MDFYMIALKTAANYSITLFSAELLFLSALGRRSKFALRLAITVPAAVAFCIGAGIFGMFVLESFGFAVWAQIAVNFVLHVLYFVATIAAMFVCFSAPATTISFACVSGYTLQHIYASVPAPVFSSAVITEMTSYAMCAALYAAAYFVFVRRMSVRLSREPDMSLIPPLVLSGAMLFVALFLGILGFTCGGESDIMYALFSACQLSFCVALLAVQFLILYVMQERRDAVIAERLHETEKKQYEAIKNNIDAVNIKFHDIRHRLREVQGKDGSTYLGDIDALISEYDAHVLTGNEALDTILTEKNYICERGKIKLSCLADGELLCGMDAGDLYSLFGNALDNAIEYLSGMPEEKRILKVFVRRYGENFVNISVKNYYEGGPLGGDPRTTKKNKAYHGFGIASMRRTAETYGGTLGLTAEGSTFCVNILLPHPLCRRI